MLFRDFRVIIRSYYGYTILKGSDGMLKRKIYDASVDAVCRNARDGGVDCGDRIQLLLKLPDLLAGGADR